MRKCRCGGTLIGYYSYKCQKWMTECNACKRITIYKDIKEVQKALNEKEVKK